ncbi:MAG: adenosylmethionine--8-amino-7-oxononanoate transaminase [Desulfovibrionaceae bacterium]
MLNQGFFITGTDTDVGKTVVTAALLRALCQQQVPVRAVKAVQTGVECAARQGQGDAALYADAVADLDTLPLAACTLRSFRLAASPHLAAREQGQYLELESLLDEIQALQAQSFLLLEGAGGVRVPLNDRADMLDIMERTGLPVIVVAANRLGVINQVLLSVETLEGKGVRVAAVVLTQACPFPVDDAAQALILQDSAPCLRARLPHIPLLELPYSAALHHAVPAERYAGWEVLAQELKTLAEQAQPCSTAGGAASAAGDGTALLAFDAAHIWHPYTSTTQPLPVREVIRTAGQRIYVRQRGGLVDGMSSWWCAIHGYGHPALVRALRQQAGRFSHVMFGGLTHDPAVRLARTLLPLLPSGLERVFFADSGSVAVEVALKMALQYHGEESARSLFIVPRGGYHGDTVGAMSVCDPVNGMHRLFKHFLPQQVFVDRPACPFGAYNTALAEPHPANLATLPFDPACLLPLEEAFARHGHQAAGCILEPVVQGAGGMWLYHPEYLRRVAALCREYGTLLIVDEIATGFGRTGKMFACEWAGISPDILCLGKALTGGMMTLAATACSARVAEGICAQGGVFMHGPTFMGNPLACAVAQASVDVLLASPWSARIANIEAALVSGLAPCAQARGVAQVRVLGAIGVVECAQAVPMARLQDFFVEQGVWLRPFGRLIYCMPPYSISPQELEQITTAVCRAVKQGIHIS